MSKSIEFIVMPYNVDSVNNRMWIQLLVDGYSNDSHLYSMRYTRDEDGIWSWADGCNEPSDDAIRESWHRHADTILECLFTDVRILGRHPLRAVEDEHKQLYLTKVAGYVFLDKHVVIADPCYDPGTWCTTVQPVQTGWWDVYYAHCIETYRVTELMIISEEYTREFLYNPNAFEAETLDTPIGVDSGMAGFYNETYYNEVKSEETAKEWYNEVCAKVSPVAILKANCAISSTGWGDGSYTCTAYKNSEGNTIAFKLNY